MTQAVMGIPLSAAERLKYLKLIENRTRPEGNCLVWSGAKANGYGIVTINALRGSPVRVNRLAYAVYKGDPGSLLVRHTCDNPSCVNPEHLLLGTQADNMRDKVTRGRCSRVGCSRPPKPINLKELRVLRMLADLGYPQRQIAAMLNLSQTTVWRKLSATRLGVK